jgi:hypothetical protein
MVITCIIQRMKNMRMQARQLPLDTQQIATSTQMLKTVPRKRKRRKDQLFPNSMGLRLRSLLNFRCANSSKRVEIEPLLLPILMGCILHYSSSMPWQKWRRNAALDKGLLSRGKTWMPKLPKKQMMMKMYLWACYSLPGMASSIRRVDLDKPQIGIDLLGLSHSESLKTVNPLATVVTDYVVAILDNGTPVLRSVSGCPKHLR